VLERTVSFDSDQIARIDACLEKLLVNSRVVAVLFADSSGQPIQHMGTLSGKDRIALSTLAAGSLAATGAMAKLLGQAGVFERVFFEGREHSIHSSIVGNGFLLSVAFDNRVKPGLVRIIAGHAAKELEAILDEAAGKSLNESVRDLIDKEFGRSLGDELDARLPKDRGDLHLREEGQWPTR
jgi:predicted regulator of Ras-like GTPase activity (Roadblock/LC7/MglB family)